MKIEELCVYVALVEHRRTDSWPTVKIAVSQAALERKVAETLLEEGGVWEEFQEEEEDEDEEDSWAGEEERDFVAGLRRATREGETLREVIDAYCDAKYWKVGVDWIGMYLPGVEITDDLDEVVDGVTEE